VSTELTSKFQSAKQPAIRKLGDGDPFFQRMKEVYDTVARRAYELFDGRGRQNGHDLEDWFHAESELLNPVPVEISQADDQVVVRADLPGYREKDIEVRVEPRRLVIAGKREEIRDETRRKTFYSERKYSEAFRTVELPESIDPDHVQATLRDGTLEIMLPKARPARKVPPAIKAA